MAVLNLRNVDPDLLRDCKSRAAYLGKTLRQYVQDALLAYVGVVLPPEGVKTPEVAPDPKPLASVVPRPSSDPARDLPPIVGQCVHGIRRVECPRCWREPMVRSNI